MLPMVTFLLVLIVGTIIELGFTAVIIALAELVGRASGHE